MEIQYLDFDDENETHLADHAITPREIRQVVENRHLTRQNPGHEGRRLLLGRSHGGRYLVISIEPAGDETSWRPVTGRDAKKDERELIQKYAT